MNKNFGPVNCPVITLDGPSGVGKGTIARLLSEKLSWHLLDSGALYRILALAAVKAKIELSDENAVAALADKLDIRFSVTPEGAEKITLNTVEITHEVRAETTGELASQIAVLAKVRAALFDMQLGFRKQPGLVADGRDMGTVVFPDAPLKFFLEASAEVRAQRRLKQLSEAGIPAILEKLCAEISARDHRDKTRAVSPLIPADDALVIDTGALSADEVFGKVWQAVEKAGLNR